MGEHDRSLKPEKGETTAQSGVRQVGRSGFSAPPPSEDIHAPQGQHGVIDPDAAAPSPSGDRGGLLRCGAHGGRVAPMMLPLKRSGDVKGQNSGSSSPKVPCPTMVMA